MKILEEKMELLRWIINLNDEQVIKNLVNFKNEIFGVPFVETSACPVPPPVANAGHHNYASNDPRLSPDYLKFETISDDFLSQFNEALGKEEAKELSIKKIQGWWRD